MMSDVQPACDFPPKRPRSLTRDLVATLSRRIRGGELRPGDKLPAEAEMVQQEGVSRTVIREAISRLQAAGLVETRHGVGTFVLEPAGHLEFHIDPAAIVTVRDVLAMLELRISLETEAAGLAAARRSDHHLAEMRTALNAFLENLEHAADTIQPDFDFHLHIAAATENRYFTQIMSSLGTNTLPRTRIGLGLVQDAGQTALYLKAVHREHEDIYQAILARDPEMARSMMRMHLTRSRERLRRAHDAAQAQSGG